MLYVDFICFYNKQSSRFQTLKMMNNNFISAVSNTPLSIYGTKQSFNISSSIEYEMMF